MRRIWITAVYLALIVLVLTLMALAGRPVETPEPTATQTPTPTPTQTPGVLVIHPPEGWDGDWEDLYVAIPVDGMEETR